MSPDSQEDYIVEDARDARIVSTLLNAYVDDDVVEFNCPSCEHSIPAADAMLEGGGTCPGCERTVQIHITSHDRYGEWKNVPDWQRGMTR